MVSKIHSLIFLCCIVLESTSIHEHYLPIDHFTIRNFVDSEIRKKFSQHTDLNSVVIQSEEEDDLIVDYTYKSGLEVVVDVCPHTQKIRVIEYYRNGKRGKPAEETLCQIPKSLIEEVRNSKGISEEEITQYLLDIGEINSNYQFQQIKKLKNQYSAYYINEAKQVEIQFRMEVKNRRIVLLSKNIISKQHYVEQYNTIQHINKHKEAIECLIYLQRSFSPLFTDGRLVKARKQAHHSRYQFTISLYVRSKRLLFLIVVEKQTEERFKIISEGYYDNNNAPSQFSVIERQEYERTTYLQEINQIISVKMAQKLSINYQLNAIQASQPYYIYIYKTESSNFLQVFLIYDYFTNSVQVLNFTQIKSVSSYEQETSPEINIVGQDHRQEKIVQDFSILQSREYIKINTKNQLLMKYAIEALESETENLNKIDPDFKLIRANYLYWGKNLSFRFEFSVRKGLIIKYLNYTLQSESSELIFTSEETQQVQDQQLRRNISINTSSITKQKGKNETIKGNVNITENSTNTIKRENKRNLTSSTAINTTNTIKNKNITSTNPENTTNNRNITSQNITIKNKNTQKNTINVTKNRNISKTDQSSSIKRNEISTNTTNSGNTTSSNTSSINNRNIVSKNTTSAINSRNTTSTNTSSTNNRNILTSTNTSSVNKNNTQNTTNIINKKTSSTNINSFNRKNTTQNSTTTTNRNQTQKNATSTTRNRKTTTNTTSTTTNRNTSANTSSNNKNITQKSTISNINTPSTNTSNVINNRNISTSTRTSNNSTNLTNQKTINTRNVENKTNSTNSTQSRNTEQKETFTYDLSKFKIDEMSSVADPKLIPFLTATKPKDVDSKSIQRIVQIIRRQFSISSSLKILLINQISYGMRMVVEVTQSKRLFEVLIDTTKYKLLFWKEIKSVYSISSEIFNQYYTIEADEQIEVLLEEVLEAKFSQIRKITMIKQRIGIDGIYYKLVMEAKSQRTYKVLLYTIPEVNYHQILLYKRLDYSYDKSIQAQFQIIPNSKDFNAINVYLYERYGKILTNATIKYIGKVQNQNSLDYRLVFSGQSGRYEVIASYQEQSVAIVKWEKLQSGYVSQAAISNSVTSFCNKQISTLLSANSTIKGVQVKRIQKLGYFYKIIYLRPFPFIVTVFNVEERIQIIGMQSIPLPPVNKYYYYEEFRKYREIKVQALVADANYKDILEVLRGKIQNSSIEGAFLFDGYDHMTYKIIFKVEEKLWLGVYEYNYIQRKGRLVSFSSYHYRNKKGTYDWKCLEKNREKEFCELCEEGYLKTLGRCYEKIPNCELQIVERCELCEAGFSKIDGCCSKHPTPFLQQKQEEKQILSTQFDFNCIRFKGQFCVKCAYRFYLKEGVCTSVQDACKNYHRATGQCFECYTGYYLKQGVCVERDPLCAKTDYEGQCIKCYKKYELYNGKCYYKNSIEQAKTENQLCEKWDGDECIQCLSGTYLNKYTKLCAIKDPYCDDFDKEEGVCNICRRGYKVSQGTCVRKW